MKKREESKRSKAVTLLSLLFLSPFKIWFAPFQKRRAIHRSVRIDKPQPICDFLETSDFQALPLLEQTLPLMKAKLGLEHIDTLQAMNNLALAYQDVGKLRRKELAALRSGLRQRFGFDTVIAQVPAMRPRRSTTA